MHIHVPRGTWILMNSKITAIKLNRLDLRNNNGNQG